jgi:hypothetical protein
MSNFEHRLDSEIDELTNKMTISEPVILSGETVNLDKDTISENEKPADQNIEVSYSSKHLPDDNKIIIDNVTKSINEWIEIYNNANIYTKIKLSKNIALRTHLTK